MHTTYSDQYRTPCVVLDAKDKHTADEVIAECKKQKATFCDTKGCLLVIDRYRSVGPELYTEEALRRSFRWLEETRKSILESSTNYQLLRLLVPDLEERLQNPDNENLLEEIRRRAVDTQDGYRPFHWWRGSM